MSETKTHRPVRCGWCLTGDHANCAATIEMGVPAQGKKASGRFTWRCPCREPGCANARTRCIRCRRRDVEVTEQLSECVDAEDCRDYLTRKRAADPTFRIIDEIRRRRTAQRDEKSSETPRKAGTTPSRPSAGECLCCGEPTRGGKFLPGHDSRYIKAQAEAYVKIPATIDGLQPADRVAIYDKMEACGPALHAKWVKAVERLKAARAREEVSV